ncbi:MAG: DegV family protein [Chloroflexota bacterium]|nr:DegV family protein [Chloroflexota bacterium]
MAKVKIVTDSTSYIPASLVQDYDISVVPLKISFSGQSFVEGIDITNEEFYQRLARAKSPPITSQPSSDEFTQTYSRLTEDDHPILSIHISAKLSGTVHSALRAKKCMNHSNIEVVDSLFTTMGLGMAVISAARAASEGQSLSQIRASTEKIVNSMSLFFVVDTPHYLHKGNLIGEAAAILGTMLDFKPILHLKDGQIQPVSRVRTKPRATKYLLEIMESRVPRDAPVHVTVIHARSPKDAASLEQEVQERFHCRETYVSELGPVIGTHVGPGALGLAFYYDQGPVAVPVNQPLEPHRLPSPA